jgi:hypothetical protein
MNKISRIAIIFTISLNSLCFASLRASNLDNLTKASKSSKTSSPPAADSIVKFAASSPSIEAKRVELVNDEIDKEMVTTLLVKAVAQMKPVLNSLGNLTFWAAQYSAHNYDGPQVMYLDEFQKLYKGRAKKRERPPHEATSSQPIAKSNVTLTMEAVLPSNQAEKISLPISRGPHIKDLEYSARSTNTYRHFERLKSICLLFPSVKEGSSLIAHYENLGELSDQATEADQRVTFNYYLYVLPKEIAEMMQSQPLYEMKLLDICKKDFGITPLTKQDVNDLFEAYLLQCGDNKTNSALSDLIRWTNEKDILGNKVSLGVNFYDTGTVGKDRKTMLSEAIIATYGQLIMPSEEARMVERKKKKRVSSPREVPKKNTISSGPIASSSNALTEVSSSSSSAAEPQKSKQKRGRSGSESKPKTKGKK